ncbi:MAG: hypothetical protein LBS60_13335 [Deltaproteobacteria bacterium]|jgi:hypothetical protein|nr:hypothetical protein [Deltaproteobacteria bacterium]
MSLQLANIFESAMLVSFGLAWPANIRNSLRIKNSKGRSLQFLIIVIVGYLFGLAANILKGNINYVTFFYTINLLMVSFDLCLYFYYLKPKDLKVAGE